ncbi:MAG: hypothetical protein ACLR67_01540 [Eggerthella lenta]
MALQKLGYRAMPEAGAGLTSTATTTPDDGYFFFLLGGERRSAVTFLFFIMPLPSVGILEMPLTSPSFEAAICPPQLTSEPRGARAAHSKRDAIAPWGFASLCMIQT